MLEKDVPRVAMLSTRTRANGYAIGRRLKLRTFIESMPRCMNGLLLTRQAADSGL